MQTKLAPRLQYLRSESESHHAEQELKMEAHFQRLLASNTVSESVLPLHSPRPTVNRGRFPDEVDPEEPTQEEDDSDDDDRGAAFGLEERAMSEDGSTALRASPAISLMDLDAPSGGSSYFSVHSSHSNSSNSGTPKDAWRQTPPPTSNGSRVGKRKFTVDDRYDPYPTAKRRAVSPSISLSQRDSMLSPLVIPRSPVIRPSTSMSAASSPVFARPSTGNGNGTGSGMMSLSSSPVLRPSVSHLSSPILRPIVRLRAGAAAAMDANAEAAGDGVGGLRLV
ncbi:hypothetical protein EXIGLDRAFT_194796 [Exidia glandulosa HHB12029]|uniref:Uncharacterized protein n=1 Tax=Exidia glandulosa HHB12029 TaxID=1314781 RepID=A0A165EV11_EXIGL|nr:hypothetical protein EXIGLDRAFT_194796 [Exidia glandulosa HHB12029]